MSDFERCLAETLRWEGGYSDHPADPGGPTMCGIIQRVYDAWRDTMGLHRRPVRDSEPRERAAIYRQQYWNAVRGDELPPGISLAVFDFGVNSGPARAVKTLQRALGLTADGAAGAVTISAAHAAANDGRGPDVVRAIMAERRRFIRQIRTYKTFGRGWESRCNGVEAAALRVCPIPPETPAVIEAPFPDVAPLPDPDAQSETQGRAPVDTRPPRAGPLTRLKGWVLAALGLGSLAGEASDALPDAQTALTIWDRVAPLAERLATSTVGIVAIAAIVLGLAAVLLGRRAEREQEMA